MGKKSAKTLVLLAALSAFAACSNKGAVQLETQTELSKEMEALRRGADWEYELEGERLTKRISTAASISREIPLSPSAFIALDGGFAQKGVYPDLSDFTNLDISDIRGEILETINGFCRAFINYTASSPAPVANASDNKDNAGSTAVASKNDTADKNASDKSDNEASELTKDGENKSSEDAALAKDGEEDAKTSDNAPNGNDTKNASDNKASDTNANSSDPEDDTPQDHSSKLDAYFNTDTLYSLVLFLSDTKDDVPIESFLLGQPFMSSTTIEVPVRFTCRKKIIYAYIYPFQVDDAWKIQQIEIYRTRERI